MGWLRRLMARLFPRSRLAQRAAEAEDLRVRLMAVGMSDANRRFRHSHRPHGEG